MVEFRQPTNCCDKDCPNDPTKIDQDTMTRKNCGTGTILCLNILCDVNGRSKGSLVYEANKLNLKNTIYIILFILFIIILWTIYYFYTKQ